MFLCKDGSEEHWVLGVKVRQTLGFLQRLFTSFMVMNEGGAKEALAQVAPGPTPKWKFGRTT